MTIQAFLGEILVLIKYQGIVIAFGYIYRMAKFSGFGFKLGFVFIFGIGAWFSATGQAAGQDLKTCNVNRSLKLESLPLPMRTIVKDIPQLSICIPIQNVRIDVASAKIGKIKNAHLILEVRGAQLRKAMVMTDGERGFKKLMKQINKEAGPPSKLVEADGKLAYYWDLGSKLSCNVSLTYDPRTAFSEAILLK